MATKPTSNISLLLLFSLLSISTTETLATFINPLRIPSCSDPVDIEKCFEDYKAACASTASADNNAAPTTIEIAANSIKATKTSCSKVLRSLKSAGGDSQSVSTCKSTFNVALYHLDKASKAMREKTNVTASEIEEVQKSVKIASQNIEKCMQEVPISSNTKNSLGSLTKDSFNLSKISLHFCGMINSGTTSAGSGIKQS